MQPETIKRIAVLGPESTGKSILTEQLAHHYQTTWIPEYARTYLSEINRAYTAHDIIEIYENQFAIEASEIKNANKFLFTDTEFIIGMVWSEYVFKTAPEYFKKMIAQFPYDLYLLTYPDLPWVYDPLRENPGKGDFFFSWYQRILSETNLNYGIVKGLGSSRLQSAIEIIDRHFGKPK